MKIILGSSSPSRRLILESMGFDDIEVMKPGIDEKAIRFDDPKALTLALANAKMDALLSQITEPAIVITADQVVTWKGEIREKPVDGFQARQFIESYAMAPAGTTGAVVIVNTANGKRAAGVDQTSTYFKPIPDNIIDELISQNDVLHCAGGLMVEHPLLQPYVERIEGTLDSVMGLPKTLVEQLIDQVK